MAPYEQRGDDKTHERMLRWLSEDPTRLADAQRDVAEWKEYLAKAVKNPVFPVLNQWHTVIETFKAAAPMTSETSGGPKIQ